MAETLGELFVVLGLKDQMSDGLESANESVEKFGSGVDDTAQNVDGFGKTSESAVSKIGKLGTALSVLSVSAGLLAKALIGPIDSYRDLSSAGEVLALQTGNTKEEMMDLVNSLYSADTSLAESKDLFNELARAGLNTKEALAEAGNEFDTLGDATKKSGGELAKTLIPGLKAMNVAITDLPVDELAVMFQETGVDANEFGNTVNRLSGKLKDVGISYQDVIKYQIALAESGKEGRQAIQAFNSAISAIEDSNTAYAESLQAVEEATRDYTDAQEDVAAAQRDAASASQDIIDAQNAVVDAMNKVADASDNIIQAQNSVADASDNLKSAEEGVLDAMEKVKDAQDAAADAANNYLDAQDKVANAADDLAEAQQALIDVNKDANATDLERLKAQNDVEEAQRKLAAAQRDAESASRDVTDANREITDSEREVVLAQDDVSASNRDLEDANAAVAKAQRDKESADRDVVKSQEAVAKAQDDAVLAQQEVVKAQEDAKKAQDALAQAQKDATTAEEGLIDKNKDGKISQEEMATALGLSSEAMAAANKILEESAGKADAYAKAQNDGISATEESKVAIDKATTSLGGLLKPLDGVIGAISNASDALVNIGVLGIILSNIAGLTGLSTVFSTITGFFSGLAGGLAPVSAFFSGILEGISVELAAVGPELLAAGGTMVAAIGAGFLLGLGGVWLLIKTGILQLIDDLGRWFEKSPIGKVVMDALKIALAPVGAIGGVIIALAKGDLAGIKDAFMEPFEQAWEALGRWKERILGIIETVFEPIKTEFGKMKDKWGEIVQGIQDIWDNNFKPIWDTLQSVANTVIGAVKLYLDDLGNKWGILVAVWKDLWDSGFKPVWDTLQSVADTVIGAVKGFLQDLSDKWAADVAVIKLIWDTIFKPIWDTLLSTADTVITTVKQFLQDLSDKWNEVVTFFQDIWDNTFKPLWDTIQAVITDVINTVKPYVDGLVGSFKTAVEWATTAISKLKEFFGLESKKSGASSSGALGSYATGTDYVPKTGLYKLHEGEAVVPASQNTGVSSSITNNSSSWTHSGNVILPNVTNYAEFKKQYEMDMRRRNARRNAI